MTLRSRLTLTYVFALIAGLALFALISVTAIDRALRSSLDARLQTAAHALQALTDVKAGRVELDVDGRTQFASLLGFQLSGAIFQRDGSTVLSNVSRPPSGLRALAMQAGENERFATLGSGDREIRAVILPVRQDATVAGAIVVWRPSDWIHEFDRTAIAVLGVGAAAIVLLALTVGGVGAARALEPLRAMASLASEIEAHDLSRRLHVRTSDELGALCAAFDRMLDRLEAAFAGQRRFTADASHELRAPLSVIRAEADLALRRERTTAEYRDALVAIAAEADRIETLVEDLLVAARADAGRFDREPVDLAVVCAAAADRIGSMAEAKGVALRVSACGGCCVLADEQACSRAILAVLHNAVKFTPPGGTVAVTLRVRERRADVVVRDTGPGFSEDGLAHAFERFWREDPARGRGSTGLGLAIARSIVETFGGTITLANAIGGGAEVCCSFPAAERPAFIKESSS